MVLKILEKFCVSASLNFFNKWLKTQHTFYNQWLCVNNRSCVTRYRTKRNCSVIMQKDAIINIARNFLFMLQARFGKDLKWFGSYLKKLHSFQKRLLTAVPTLRITPQTPFGAQAMTPLTEPDPFWGLGHRPTSITTVVGYFCIRCATFVRTIFCMSLGISDIFHKYCH